MKVILEFHPGNGMEKDRLMSWLQTSSEMLFCSGLSEEKAKIAVDSTAEIDAVLSSVAEGEIKHVDAIDRRIDFTKLKRIDLEKQAMHPAGGDLTYLMQECIWLWQRNSCDLFVGYALKDDKWSPLCWLVKNDTICDFTGEIRDEYCGQCLTKEEVERLQKELF